MPSYWTHESLVHMFAYLKLKPKLTIAFDPRHPFIEESRFITCDWSDIYPDAAEDIPSDLPPPLGNDVSTTCFVDASHGSNLKNRRSQTGILIFLNRAPIHWYSKYQNTVESSTFGSEFIAMIYSFLAPPLPPLPPLFLLSNLTTRETSLDTSLLCSPRLFLKVATSSCNSLCLDEVAE